MTQLTTRANMHIVDKTREVEIKSEHWSLAESLFVKWGYHIDIDNEIIEVPDLDKVTPEISAWGVPWKWR